MQTITLKKQENFNPKDWLKNPAYTSHVTQIVDSEFIAVDEQGITQMVYAKMPQTSQNYPKLRAVLQKLKYGKSTRVGGLSTESTTFGFQPPLPIRMRPYCSMTGLASKYPAVDAFLAHFCREEIMPIANEMYRDKLKEHAEATKQVNKDWFMQGIPFTGGIINNSNQLNYHIDIQNIPASIGAMIYFVKDTDGGELVIPEYDVAVKPKDGYALLFRNDIVHGVAPITKLNKSSYRFSIVYYVNKGMDKCGTMPEELSKARKVSNKSHD